MKEEPPFILTLQLNEDAFLYFNKLRQEHFPRERNFIDAHLTLFHHLPPEHFIIERVQKLAEEQKAVSLYITGIVSLGSGTAFKVESSELALLHKQLQQQWQPWLTNQDKQKLWPHITVQNKVVLQEAVLLKQILSSRFVPFSACGVGLQIWKYLNGPWELFKTFPFLDRE